VGFFYAQNYDKNMQKSIKILNVDGKNYIVVDNEAFDWEIEPEQLRSIEVKIKNDPPIRESLIGNILSHMTSCFSEFIGRKVSLKEINDAIENGCI
jgi:uncharacterized protein YneF (UPF0154 family)